MLTSYAEFTQTMAIVLFLMGLISLGTGIFILTRQAIGNNVRVIAEQTAKLAQKGIAEDVAGLVGNASSLLNALNQMVRSSSGIGMILVGISFILIGASYALVLQLK
jgi:ABC-type uncharacterized transport system permease subunit